jgi:hypothetical protein
MIRTSGLLLSGIAGIFLANGTALAADGKSSSNPAEPLFIRHAMRQLPAAKKGSLK